MMSFDVALARMAQLQSMFTPAAVAAPATSPTAFASELQNVGGAATLSGVPAAAPATGAGQAMLNAVRGEVGVAEQPSGSNDSPRIAQYRQATAGSGVGPVVRVLRLLGRPRGRRPARRARPGLRPRRRRLRLGPARRQGDPDGQRVTPQSGDLIVWDEHIGVVESIDPDGTIHTIEGNSCDQVSRRTYAPGARDAIGYVRLG